MCIERKGMNGIELSYQTNFHEEAEMDQRPTQCDIFSENYFITQMSTLYASYQVRNGQSNQQHIFCSISQFSVVLNHIWEFQADYQKNSKIQPRIQKAVY